jgi:hypothetical protein
MSKYIEVNFVQEYDDPPPEYQVIIKTQTPTKSLSHTINSICTSICTSMGIHITNCFDNCIAHIK